MAEAASAPLGGAAEITAVMGFAEVSWAAAVAASVDPGGPSGQPHCRITRPSPRPLAGPEVVGTPGDANDVSRPGLDRWRCRGWVGS